MANPSRMLVLTSMRPRLIYHIATRGEYAGVSMYPSKFALCTENGPQTLATEALFEGEP